MNISRRDFLKGSLAGAAAVAVSSVAGVSAFADDAAEAAVVPEGLTEAEVKDSIVELGTITPDEEVDVVLSDQLHARLVQRVGGDKFHRLSFHAGA